MSGQVETSGFSHGQASVTGVLLVNLGTPDAPTPGAVRRYLAEFLWDPRVVDGFPRALWWLILHGVILRIRPRRSAAAYSKIWTERGSPLLDISQRQAGALGGALAQACSGPVVVELGMRYGNPSIAEAIRRLQAANARRVLVLPLYPQYSCSTTASTFDAVASALRGTRWMPELRFINHYHDDPGYITALVNSIRGTWETRPQAEKLLFSFHGTPQRFLHTGDPYYCMCSKTARLVAEALGLADSQWMLTFQSRFGREPWLQPATVDSLRSLAASGVKSVDVVCPGFSADCLETLEEIEVENRHAFMQAGGAEYHYIPALNDGGEHIAALTQLIGRHLSGWALAAESPAELAERQRRADRCREAR